LTREILADRRIISVYPFRAVVMSHRSVVPDIADAILARLSFPEAEREPGTDAYFAVALSTYLSREQLESHKPAILGILSSKPNRSALYLLFAAARLGQEGLPLLIARLNDEKAFDPAIQAVCLAHPSIRASLVPIVGAKLKDPGRNEHRYKILLAFASVAGADAAKAAIASLPEAEQGRLSSYLEKHIESDGRIACPET
jgi:ferric iron reductase protein FhuF